MKHLSRRDVRLLVVPLVSTGGQGCKQQGKEVMQSAPDSGSIWNGKGGVQGLSQRTGENHRFTPLGGTT